MCDEIGNNLTSWSSMSQFNDLVWGELESSDHMVPEWDNNSEQIAWVTVDNTRRMLQQEEQSFALVKNSGPISQHSWGLRDFEVVQHIAAEKKETSYGLDMGLETVTPSSGGECLAMKEELKGDHTVPRSGDLAAYMMDYSEEDASIETLPCNYGLGDMDFDESELSLFAEDSEKVDTDKGGKNAVNWDAVDTLLRTDSSFAQVLRCNPDELQWPGSLCSSDLQSSISMPPVRSSPDSDRKLEFNAKMEFISMDSPLSLPSSPIMQQQGCGVDNNSKLEPDKQLQPLRESTSNLNEKDPLNEGKKTAPLQTVEDQVTAMAAVETSQDNSGPSSFRLLESEKAISGQVHNAQKHVGNQNRSEENIKRHPKCQRVVQGMPHVSFQQPHQWPMPYQLLLPRHHNQSFNNHLGYPPDVKGPIMPCMTAGYAPPMHLLPALPPNLLHSQMQQQQQGLYTNCHAPCPGPADIPLHHQLPQREFSVPCPSSSSSMTPQEKLEKLRWWQQMQAQLAVQQQQQQLALQGLTAIVVPVLPKMDLEPSEIMPVSHLKQSAISLSVKSSSEMSLEVSLSVGQTNAQPSLVEEEQTMDTDVLLQLQNTIAKLADKTRLFIRDALYRLAQSARKRQATGVSGNQSSDEDSEYDLELSTSGCQPSSLANTSRVVKMVETQTNPIDRSIAHLLFHQRASWQPKSLPHVSPAAGSTFPPRSGQGTMNGLQIWHLEALPSASLAPDMLQPSTLATFLGTDALQPSTLISEELASGLGRRPLKSGNTEEQTGIVTLDHHANFLPSLSTENQSAVVTLEGPAAASSQEGMDAITVGPEVIVPGSKLKVGQKDMESQPKQLQPVVGLSELSMYEDEIALLEPGAATDKSFVLISCPSHPLSSVQAWGENLI